MRRFLFAAATVLAAGTASAQESEGAFSDYDAYSTFVDENMMKREFVALITNLGGSDEYTPEQLVSTTKQLLNVWPRDFDNAVTFNEVDLGGGIRQEARAYWSESLLQYAYMYVLFHERDDKLYVLEFNVNSSASKILAKF